MELYQWIALMQFDHLPICHWTNYIKDIEVLQSFLLDTIYPQQWELPEQTRSGNYILEGCWTHPEFVCLSGKLARHTFTIEVTPEMISNLVYRC